MDETKQGFRDGLVIVHTGDGKGKTTAALGLAVRAVGHGNRVAMIQFIKGDRLTGERAVAGQLEGALTIRSMGAGFVVDEWRPEDVAAAREAWAAGRDALASGEHEMVILDEITYVLNAGVVSVAEVLSALASRPEWLTVVLTGRDAPAELIAAADLVTEMCCVKHPYDAGIRAQPGIEY